MTIDVKLPVPFSDVITEKPNSGFLAIKANVAFWKDIY